MNRIFHDVYFNFHGKVTIHISTINQHIFDGYNVLFRQFKPGIKTGSQKYFIRDYSCFELPPHFFFVNKDHIRFEQGFCFPNERYAVTVKDDGITEFTDAAYRATHFWLQFLLLRQNLCMIHGAGFELNGRGIIFPSFSGGGKTTLVANFRNLKGFRFFSDEFVIIDNKGTMFSYPCDFSMYHHHLDLFPELQKPEFLNYFKYRKRIRQFSKNLEKIPVPSFLQTIKKFMFNTLARVLDWPLKIPVTDIIPEKNLGTEKKVDVAILLTRYSGTEITFKEIEHTDIIDKIIRIFSLEFKENCAYLHVLSACDIITPESYEQKQKEILSASLSGVKVFEVLVPHSMDPLLFSDSIIRFLDTI